MLRGLFMSTKMKIIMENWRSNLNEQVEVQTVGQLVRLLNLAIQSKRKKLAADSGSKEVVDAFLGLFPGMGAVKSVGDLLKKVYSMPDEKKTQTALDYLNVDDQISAIVDDRVENAFLKCHFSYLFIHVTYSEERYLWKDWCHKIFKRN